MIQDKILDIERSVIGKSSSPWAKDNNDIIFTYLGMGISLIYSLLYFINITSDEGTSIKDSTPPKLTANLYKSKLSNNFCLSIWWTD